MYKDEIITELWKNRESYVNHYHHDLNKIIDNLKARQKQSDRLIIDRRLSIKVGMNLQTSTFQRH